MSHRFEPPRCAHRSPRAVLHDLARDLERYPRRRPGALSVLALFTTPQLQIVLLHRAAHLLHARGWLWLAQLFGWLSYYLHKAAISPASCIGGGLYLASPVGVGFHGSAGARLTLSTRSLCGSAFPLLAQDIAGAPKLGDDVVLGTQAVVMGPVVLGDRVRVGFNVVLGRDAPADVLVASRGMLSRVTERRETPS